MKPWGPPVYLLCVTRIYDLNCDGTIDLKEFLLVAALMGGQSGILGNQQNPDILGPNHKSVMTFFTIQFFILHLKDHLGMTQFMCFNISPDKSP